MSKIKYVIPIIIILFVALAMLISYDFYLDYRAEQVNQAQTSPSNSAKALLDALVSNDKYMLNAIVIPEQQDEVSKWLATHKPFNCTKLDALVASFPDIPDASSGTPRIYVVDNQPVQDTNTVYINYALYSCLLDRSSFGGLNFEVREIVLEKRGNRWYVKSWDRICQSGSVAGCG